MESRVVKCPWVTNNTTSKPIHSFIGFPYEFNDQFCNEKTDLIESFITILLLLRIIIIIINTALTHTVVHYTQSINPLKGYLFTDLFIYSPSHCHAEDFSSTPNTRLPCIHTHTPENSNFESLWTFPDSSNGTIAPLSQLREKQKPKKWTKRN